MGIPAFTVIALPIGEDVFEYWFKSQGSPKQTRLVTGFKVGLILMGYIVETEGGVNLS